MSLSDSIDVDSTVINPSQTNIISINQSNLQNEIDTKNVDENFKLKLYPKRWLVLFIFSCVSLINAYNWIEHNIIQDVIELYYNQSLPQSSVAQNDAVDWLSMVYMLCYIPLVFPTMFLLDIKGLKFSVVLGALLTCIGASIKCAAINSKRFAILMLGQTICAIAQAFTLGLPARLSALWFGESEIATATSIGVFGNQLGNAIGFLIPPSVVPDNTSIETISNRFYYLYISVAVLCGLLFILSLIG